MSRIKQQAYDDINNAIYSGERRHMTFEHYIDKHATAYQILAEHGVIIEEEKKVTDFLRGIVDSSIKMACAKALVIGNDLMRHDFRVCTEYLSTFTANTPNSTSRSIATMGGRGRGSQGRGRGRGGRSGRGGRGGRGRGRGSGNVHLENYTDDQWAALTGAQKEEVRRLRAQQKRESKREVGSVEGDRKETPPATSQQNAGDQFGASNKKPKSS